MKLDQISDHANVQLYRALRGIDLPEFVKEAELDTEESVRDLPKTAYADPITFSFPIDTPARVYVSNAFFQTKKAEMCDKLGDAHTSAVEERIKQAADTFSISRELEAYNEVHSKRASADYLETHVAEFEDPDVGKTIALFPVKTAADFVKAAEVFDNNLHKYPFEWRSTIAKAFLSKTAEYGVDELPDRVCKYAGLFLPVPPSQVSQEISRRANRLSSKEARDRMHSLASAVAETAFESVDDVMKIATIVDFIETEDGAQDRPKTAEHLPDPVDMFFTIPPTKAAEILDVINMAGNPYPVRELKKVSSDIYKQAFGVDLDPSNESALRDILPTMPLSDVELFKELSGVNPVQ